MSKKNPPPPKGSLSEICCCLSPSLLTLNLACHWNNYVLLESINISFEIYKWVFAACIVLSFILLAWDMKKAAAIIQSRDISYAFTSMIAYRYYAIKSYAHFCLFSKIHNSKKQIDEIAFFCFFTFRGNF